MSQWIWKFGDFETYHSLLVHDRRTEFGNWLPVIWKLYSPEPVVRFEKIVTTQGGTICVRACGKYTVTIFGKSFQGEKKYGEQEAIPLPPGTVKIQIRVCNFTTFPSVYVEGIAESDESWVADDVTGQFEPVGTWASINNKEWTPDQFPFSYAPAEWVNRELVDNGVLYDFGKETFCKTSLTGLTQNTVSVRMGESRPEALSPDWCIVRFEESPQSGKLELPASAFRYVYISDPGANIAAQYEYLPVARRGSFHCEDETVNWVWETAAHTFHLNSREFFLDGIKRDRWVWSGDAYQSQFVNHYLFFDKEIEKRTLIALGGKRPFRQHINTIMDYTFFWFMGLYDYYLTYGDTEFLRQIYPQAEEIMTFCQNRRSPDGLMRSKAGDWVFIDWADFDKKGAVLGEQILFAQAINAYGKILEVLGMNGQPYQDDAARLQQRILDLFYDQEQGAFIDSYESGRKHITRHNNILAYLYLPCSQEQRDSIYRNVMCNEAVPPITTPYFKFYENRVHCEAGNIEQLEACIHDYYGAMKAHGATSLYEQFDPSQHGDEHYAMYGTPYGKSLCHAWSASPIYLLGRYRLGVKNTGVAYNSFVVEPILGSLPPFEGTVPLPDGEVTVRVEKDRISVLSTVPGGVLKVDRKECPLEPGILKTVVL